MNQRIHKSIEIKAPVEKVFAYMEDPHNEPDWAESLIDVKNICGSGAGTHYECSWKMGGVQLHGETTRTEDIPNKRIVDETRGEGINTWTYTFEPHENSTTVDLDVVYTIPEQVRRKLWKTARQLIFEQGEEVVYRNNIPIMAKLVDTFICKRTEQEIEQDMQNVKDRLEI